MTANTQNRKVLTQSEKNKLIEEHLGKDLDLQGANLAIINKVLDYISYVDTGAGVAEVAIESAAILLPKVGAVIKSGIFVAAAEGLAVSSVVLFPLAALISILNAYEVANRQYGMRAVSYTTVAWSFSDLIPLKSPTIEQNVRHNLSNGKQAIKTLNGLQKAWFDSSSATLLKLNKAGKKGNKEALQLVFKAMGDNNRQKLNLAILKGFAKNMSYQDKIWFEGGYSIRYPA